MKKNTATDVAVSQRITCKFCLKHNYPRILKMFSDNTRCACTKGVIKLAQIFFKNNIKLRLIRLYTVVIYSRLRSAICWSNNYQMDICK